MYINIKQFKCISTKRPVLRRFQVASVRATHEINKENMSFFYDN